MSTPTFSITGSQNVFNNVALPTNGKLLMGTTKDCGVFSPSSGLLKMQSLNATGSAQIYAGSGGITIDSTVGDTSGVVNGAVNIYSGAHSAWSATASNISIGTTGTGDLIFNTGSAGDISIGQNTGTLTIGNSSSTTTVSGTASLTGNVSVGGNFLTSGNMRVAGDLTVDGTMYIADQSQINVEDKFLLLNTSYGNNNPNAGTLIQQSGADVVANNTFVDTGTTQNYGGTLYTSTVANTIVPAISSSTYVTEGNWIKMTSGPFLNQFGQIVSVAANGTATIATSNNSALSGTTFEISGSAGSMLLVGTGSLFTSELLPGSRVRFSSPTGSNEYYVVNTVTSNTEATLTDSNLFIATYTGGFVSGNWTPVAGYSGNTTSSTTLLVSSNSNYTEGMTIKIIETAIATNFKYVVITAIVDDAINMTLTISSALTFSGAVTIEFISPGEGITYYIYENLYSGTVWDSVTDRFKFVSSTSSTEIADETPLDVFGKKLLFTNASLSLNEGSTNGGTWNGADYTSLPSAGGALVCTDGGISVNNISTFNADTNTDVVSFIQNTPASTGQCAGFVQSSLTAPFLSFTGVSGDTATNTSLVLDNANITAATIKGYMKIKIFDNSTAGTILNGTYYMPLYTLT